MSTSELDWSFYIVSIAREKVRTMICWMKFSSSRSSYPEEFCKEGVLGNFAKLTGKYLCQSLFFNKVAGLRPSFKNRSNFREHIFYRTPWWMLVFLRLCLHGALLSRKKHLSKKHLDKVDPKKTNLDQNINDSKSDIFNFFWWKYYFSFIFIHTFQLTLSELFFNFLIF